MNALLAIQCELKVPKRQFNKFGNFRYRSCEDILEAVKPIFEKYDAVLTLSDRLISFNNYERFYVNTTATLKVGGETYTSEALAGIDLAKKGMDFAQATGAASSYARKYALSGLLLIDDGQDSDAQEPPAAQSLPARTVPPLPPPPPPIQRPAAPAVMPPPPPPPR